MSIHVRGPIQLAEAPVVANAILKTHFMGLDSCYLYNRMVCSQFDVGKNIPSSSYKSECKYILPKHVTNL